MEWTFERERESKDFLFSRKNHLQMKGRSMKRDTENLRKERGHNRGNGMQSTKERALPGQEEREDQT